MSWMDIRGLEGFRNGVPQNECVSGQKMQEQKGRKHALK